MCLCLRSVWMFWWKNEDITNQNGKSFQIYTPCLGWPNPFQSQIDVSHNRVIDQTTMLLCIELDPAMQLAMYFTIMIAFQDVFNRITISTTNNNIKDNREKNHWTPFLKSLQIIHIIHKYKAELYSLFAIVWINFTVISLSFSHWMIQFSCSTKQWHHYFIYKKCFHRNDGIPQPFFFFCFIDFKAKTIVAVCI